MIGTEKNERRDWTLLIFIIPIGIILIILVGQLAVRLVPFWRMNTDMTSNLEPDASSARPFALLEPILPQILTPMAWVESYLTPGAEISFPPFLTFEPSATPTSTPNTPAPTVDTPSPTSTTPSPIPTGTAEPTNPSNGGGGGGGGGVTTCQDPVADNFGGTLPCDYTSTTTCTDPVADNFGGSLPCDYTSTTTCTDSGANNFGGLLPCDYGTISTPDSSLTLVTPPPTEIGVGTLPDNTNPYDDSNIGHVIDGTYILISLSIQVGATPDNNYDLAYYEWNNGGYVYLDWIIIGISKDSGATYYEVFNWGNGIPDSNSNVGDVAGTEDDNQPIDLSELYDPDASPPPNGPAPQTGILIDVDTADSNPPAGTYNTIVIISPNDSDVNDPEGTGANQPAQIDSIETVEVPIPTP